MSYVDKVKVGDTTYDIQDAGAVRAVTGKGLSTNDYTNAEKAKLAGIEAGAQANVVPEWSDIKHKPTTIAGFGITNAYTKDEVDTALDGKANKATTLAGYGITNAYTKDAVDSKLSDKVDKVSGKGLSTNDFTNAEKTKLAGIEAGAQVNVAPYWSDVQDKPTTLSGYGITNAYTKGEVVTALAGKVDKVNGKGLSSNDYTDSDIIWKNGISVFCKCETDSDIPEKVITPVYPSGARIHCGSVIGILFRNTNTAYNPTFNYNNGGDAKEIQFEGSTIGTKNLEYAGHGNTLLLYMYNGSFFYYIGGHQKNIYTSGLCNTEGNGATKIVECTNYTARDGNYLHIILANDNTAQEKLYLYVNDIGYQPIYINDEISSPTNYTLPAGSYIVYYHNYNYYFRTDGKIPGITAVPVDSYTKGEIDAKLANIEGGTPEWADVQHKPKTIAGYGITDAYTKSEVDAAIAGIDGGTPDWADVQNKPTTVAGFGITDAYTKSETDAALSGKVDAVSGKGLSTNDYTDVEKAKLAGLTSTPDFSDIQNTPTTLAGYGITNAYTKGEVDTALAGKVDAVSGKGLSTNDYTDAEKAKVAAMPGISISGNKLVITQA